ncbi:MAG TPA: hypothetical protein VGO16_08235 [Pseudonocardiaceae bacterium]|nr:hypothetical protein [Pseudonocardiaceae bacterium]
MPAHASLFEEGVEIGQTGTHPFKRSGRQLLDVVARARLPLPEGRVMVSAVQAARETRHRLQEVDLQTGRSTTIGRAE